MNPTVLPNNIHLTSLRSGLFKQFFRIDTGKAKFVEGKKGPPGLLSHRWHDFFLLGLMVTNHKLLVL